MKKYFFLLFIGLLTTFQSLAQGDPWVDSMNVHDGDSIIFVSPSRIPILAGVSVRFATSADVYLKWGSIPNTSIYTLRYKWGGDYAPWTTVGLTTTEMVITNVPLDATVLWDVQVPNTISAHYQSDVGVVSTYRQTEPIKVSHKLYNELEDWFSNDTPTDGFCTFFRGVAVHRYEKLAFLQAYVLDNAPMRKPTDPESDIKDWYPPNTVFGSGGDDECVPFMEGCNCKVISDGVNIATPNGGRDMAKQKILPLLARYKATAGPDDTWVNRYEAGASKSIGLSQSEKKGGMTYKMSNLTTSGAGGAVTSEASEVTFFLACKKPSGSSTSNIPSSCLCERPLELRYEYTTRLKVKAEKRNCAWSKGAEATAEDMAFVGLYEGKTGKLTPLDAGRAMLSRSCSSNWNPDFWIKTLDVVAVMADYYIKTKTGEKSKIPTKGQIDTFRMGLDTLIKTKFRNQSGSCETVVQDTVLVSGTKFFSLKPNAPIRVALFSSYYVRTRGYGCWYAQAGVASDYFLAGVVESQLTNDPECCSSKFANYILGAVSGPEGNVADVYTVNTTENRLEDVGAFLGSYGDWYNLTRDPGSGQILLTHEYDRIWGPSCADDGGGLVGEGGDRSRAKTHTTAGVFSVYPALAEDHITVAFDVKSKALAHFSVMDAQGRIWHQEKPGIFDIGQYQLPFDTSKLPNGIYVLRGVIGQEIHNIKIIKI